MLVQLTWSWHIAPTAGFDLSTAGAVGVGVVLVPLIAPAGQPDEETQRARVIFFLMPFVRLIMAIAIGWLAHLIL